MSKISATKKYYISSKTNLILILISFFASLLLYALSPNYYSYPIVVAAFILFIITAINFFAYRKNNNYFSFEFLFTVTFTFVYFLYPIFIYPINKHQYFMFSLGFNEDVITKSTLLALIGYNFFIMGHLCKGNNSISLNVNKSQYIANILPTVISFIYSLIHLVIIATSKIQYYGTNPWMQSGTFAYFGILANSIIIVAIAIEFHNLLLKGIIKKWWQHNLLLWIALALEIASGVISGSRTFAIQIALMVFAGYAMLNKGINLKQILLLILCGLCCMRLILVARSNGIFKFSFNMLDMGMDLIITNYTLYTGYDYVQSSGTIPFTLFGSLLSIVPFLQGAVVDALNIPIWETSSARFFSYLAMGENPTFGVGTNIIASTYLALGFWGTIFFMYLFGFFISYISSNVNKSSIYHKILFLGMIGFSVYIVRSDYFYAISRLSYALLFGMLVFGKFGKILIPAKRGDSNINK
ncbi:MAG: oligosaccharide repeat unit polymerase [Salinivirgaceae bacterium]|nr:oligosaccharide repeat unit polymerase [Salinivirgaceae bacterium]